MEERKSLRGEVNIKVSPMNKRCKKRRSFRIKVICLDCLNINPKGKIKYQCISKGSCLAIDLSQQEIEKLFKKQRAI